MDYFQTTVTPLSAGIKTVTCGFPPKAVRITASQRSTNSDNVVRQSVGSSDGTKQMCTSQYYDGASGGTPGPQKFSDRIVSVRNRASSTSTPEVLAAHIDQSYVDGGGNSAAWTTTEMKYIVDVADSYQLHIEIFG